MPRFRLAVLTVALAWASMAGAQTRTYFGFQIGVGDAPPPPRVFGYQSAVTVIPGTSVYMVDTDGEYDLFRYGGFYYVMEDGYWYRARRYGGPYFAVDVRRVPQPILSLPASHWRHRDWQSQARWRDRDQDWRYRRNPRYDDWNRNRYDNDRRDRRYDSRDNHDHDNDRDRH